MKGFIKNQKSSIIRQELVKNLMNFKSSNVKIKLKLSLFEAKVENFPNRK